MVKPKYKWRTKIISCKNKPQDLKNVSKMYKNSKFIACKTTANVCHTFTQASTHIKRKKRGNFFTCSFFLFLTRFIEKRLPGKFSNR